MPAEIVAIVGAGTMGAGIAQVALENGHEVVLHDVDELAVERGRERIRDGLMRRARKVDMDDESADEWAEGRLANLREATSLDEASADADVVIEAALEDLELKRTIFRALDAAAPAEAILATNTIGAVGRRDRRGDGSAGPGGRPSLLQPGAGHAARRGRGARGHGSGRSSSGRARSWRHGARPPSARPTSRASSSTG